MSLIIDSRESSIITILQERCIPFTQQLLDIGDILLHDYIIERKTFADLASSITDGRFREQKDRLSQISDKKVVYLIEHSNHKFSDKTLLSAIINLTLNHNFQVLFSNNVSMSCDIIELLLSKKTSSSSIPLVAPVLKKSTKLLHNALACQLNSIHGISWKVSLQIQEEYHTMNNLLTNYSNNPHLLKHIGNAINTNIKFYFIKFNISRRW